MKLELHEIKYFLALAQELHFGRAALASNVSQPALTRAIRSLENKLGGLLFHRRPNDIQLTALGHGVLPRLRNAYAELQAVVDDASTSVAAKALKIRVGAMCTIGPHRIVSLLDALRRHRPDIEITMREAKSQTIVDLLLHDEIDIAVAAWPHYPDRIEAIPLLHERYAVAFAAGHLFEASPEVQLDQLEGERYIERLNCEFDDHFAAQAGDWNLDLDVSFSSESEDWIQALVAAGQGIAIVPEFMPLRPGIVTRPLIDPGLHRDVCLLTRRDHQLCTPTAALVRLARSQPWDG